MGDEEYYLITHGINHSSGCSYRSLVIEVHSAIWLLKQRDCFFHAWENVSPEIYREYRQIIETQRAKEQRIKDEKELKQSPKKHFELF